MGEVKAKKLSYSALSLFDNCQLRYYLKYIAGNYSNESSLALELGTLAHKVKELISLDLMACQTPDYIKANDVLLEGWEGVDKSSQKEEKILGVTALRQKYWSDWFTADNKSGLSYDEKIGIFREHLRDEERNLEWYTIGVEVPFEFEFEGVVFHGFIDRLAMNNKEQIAIFDYKTSKAVYDDSYIKTPLQMLIYHMAVEKMFPGHEIIHHTYDFIFIGEQQEGGSPGWLARGEKKLRSLLAKMEMNKTTGIWEPKPSPLCHYCEFCKTKDNPEASLSSLCPYYSQWLPDNKVYTTAKKWDGRKAEEVLSHEKNKKSFTW